AVPRVERLVPARLVEVATGAPDGGQVAAGLELELRLAPRPSVQLGAGGNGDPGDVLVAVAEREPEHRVRLLALLDEPDHLLGGVTELFRRRAEVKQATQG